MSELVGLLLLSATVLPLSALIVGAFFSIARLIDEAIEAYDREHLAE